MENKEPKLVQVGDTEIWYDPETGVNYIKHDKCGSGMTPVVDRTGKPVIDYHKN